MRRREAILVAIALAVALLAGSTPRPIGDGGEYLVQAYNFGSFGGPSISRRDIPRIHAQLERFDPGFATWEIERSSLAGKGGGRDFLHFWFYALLATPFLWITEAASAAPTYAFAALNLLCLIGALWVAWPRVGGATALLVFAGPIIWWLDKAHTEPFTVALLTIAFLLARERPGVAMMAAGAASTQNPPLAALVPLIGALAFIDDRTRLRNRAFLVSVLGAGILSSLHPVYTLWRHGTPTLLLSATKPGWPTWAEVSAVVFDPSIGLLGNFPFLLVAVVFALVVVVGYTPRQVFSATALLVMTALALFAYSFAQPVNMHHGGTPSMTRYALWLAPLSLPLLAAAKAANPRVWTRVITPIAVASALVCAFAFHPGVPQNTREPTWLAMSLWRGHPGWTNPLPEIFIETQLHIEQMWAPVATVGCEKILVAGEHADRGVWPMPCYPVDVPAECRQAGSLCYANRLERRYAFAPAPGRLTGTTSLRSEATWPAAAESAIRSRFDAWQWWTFVADPPGGDLLTGTHDVRATMLGRAGEYVFALGQIGSEASLEFRPTAHLSGELIDPVTNTVVMTFHFEQEPERPWDVQVPTGFDALILHIKTGGPTSRSGTDTQNHVGAPS